MSDDKPANRTAPPLDSAAIDSLIVEENFYIFPGSMTICALLLRNGCVVVGESAAASPEIFDEAIGRRIARERAREKIAFLEGYLLRSRLAE